MPLRHPTFLLSKSPPFLPVYPSLHRIQTIPMCHTMMVERLRRCRPFRSPKPSNPRSTGHSITPRSLPTMLILQLRMSVDLCRLRRNFSSRRQRSKRHCPFDPSPRQPRLSGICPHTYVPSRHSPSHPSLPLMRPLQHMGTRSTRLEWPRLLPSRRRRKKIIQPARLLRTLSRRHE